MSVPAKSPIVPGHEIVGRVVKVGDYVETLHDADRVGIRPLWSTCGKCEFCFTGRGQICQSEKITGEDVDSGYAGT
jgi:propanol-preferring alcohol dehydrogenase